MSDAVDQGGTVATDTGSGWIADLMNDGNAGEAVADAGVENAEIAADDAFPDEGNGEGEIEYDDEPDEIVLKVYDNEVKLSSDEVIQLAQKQLASETKFEELKEKNRQFHAEVASFEQKKESMRQFFGMLSSGDPEQVVDVFNALGEMFPGVPSFDQLVDSYINNTLEWNNLSEPERKLRVVEREKAKIEAEKKRLEEEHSRRIKEENGKAAFANVMAVLPGAFQEVGLENNPTNLRRVAEVWQQTLVHDAKAPPDKRFNLTPRQVVEYVKNEQSKRRYDDLSGLSDEELLQKLPPELVARLGKASVKQARKPFQKHRSQNSNIAKPAKPGEYRSMNEYLKKNGW